MKRIFKLFSLTIVFAFLVTQMGMSATPAYATYSGPDFHRALSLRAQRRGWWVFDRHMGFQRQQYFRVRGWCQRQLK